MYKELAVIKDENIVTDFVVWDGQFIEIVSMDDMKKFAAKGNVDTLDYQDGKFVPIIQGDVADELRNKRLLKRVRKTTGRMTFEQFVDHDCIFRKKDVDLMLWTKSVVLANIVFAHEMRIGDVSGWMLTLVLWTTHPDMEKCLFEILSSYNLPKRGIRSQGGFIMVNVPLSDPRTGFDILTFQEKTHLNFIYNIDMMENMKERMEHMMCNVGCLERFFMKNWIPTDKGLAGLKGVLREANHLSEKSLEKESERKQKSKVCEYEIR